MLQILSDTVRSSIRAARRRDIESFIRYYYFPKGLRRKIADRLGVEDGPAIERVLLGLREYFTICLDRRDMVLGMPSKAVDAAWHEFILYTRDYTDFCQKALGEYLHHTPDDAMSLGDDFLSDAGRRWMDVARTWNISCIASGQNPRRPTEVPLLFSLDAELGIAGGEAFTLEDLAALPIPHNFIETSPGRYRYIARKNRQKQESAYAGGAGCGGGCGGSGGHHGQAGCSSGGSGCSSGCGGGG